MFVVQLSSECVTYQSLETSGLNLTAINPALAAPWSFPPSPANGMPDNARCAKGPCVNACCTTAPATGFCVDNLITQGGLYYPCECPPHHPCTNVYCTPNAIPLISVSKFK